MALTFGEKITRARDRKGWSRRELAERAGLHPSHIGMIERGERSDIRRETVAKLAEALEVPLEYLQYDNPDQYAELWWANLGARRRLEYRSYPFRGILVVLGRLTELYGPEEVKKWLQERWPADSDKPLDAVVNWDTDQEGDWKFAVFPTEPAEITALAKVLGLPEDFTRPVAHDQLEVFAAYQPVIEKAHALGITPDKLEELLGWVASLQSQKTPGQP